MGCLGNSKTEDQRIDEKAQREANKKIEKQLQKERLAYKATHRLLLLGKEGGRRVGGKEGAMAWAPLGRVSFCAWVVRLCVRVCGKVLDGNNFAGDFGEQYVKSPQP